MYYLLNDYGILVKNTDRRKILFRLLIVTGMAPMDERITFSIGSSSPTDWHRIASP